MGESSSSVGWVRTKFTEVLDVQGGTQPPKSEFIDNAKDGYIRLLQIRDFGKKPVPTYVPRTSKLKTCDYSDVLIGRYGASLGRICTGMEGAYNVALAKVVTFGGVDTAFLKAYLESDLFQGPLRLLSRSAQNGFNKEDLATFDFVLPPLAEQKAIADKLDTLLAQVENTKARLECIPQILKRFRQSVLAAAVSGKLTEDWRAANPIEGVSEHVEKINAAKSAKLKVRVKKGWDEKLHLFELPSTWAWIPNHKLAVDHSNAICAGPFGTIFKAKDFRPEGVPIIFLRHVKEAGFNQDKPTYMDAAVWQELHQDYSVHGGELLVTKLGDPPGESCVFPEDFGAAMVTPDVLKMNVDTSLAETEYLKHFFNSPIAKEMVGDLAFGATRLRIDIAMFKSMPIPLPPKEEQVEIVRRVGEHFWRAEVVEARVRSVLERMNTMSQSLLAKAFRGELTEQWRNDNPELIEGDNSAEALLAKIQGQKTAANLWKRGRSKGN